ncbi:enediyne antibiotic chromoprotein [Amycolatopsis sp. NBC_00345]|uniref:enediyne antibiotic chromoprotein n=1 Tax=Amycolatopsis sp. NBC_00345 TaxID=2975955 RepID=UPI002E2729C2
MKSLRIGLAAAAALAASIAIAPVATAAAEGPRVTVDPADHLHSVATVHVTATGYTPGVGVFVQQCAQVAEGVVGCDYNGTETLDLNKHGAGTATVRVHRVFEAHSANGDLMGNIDCADAEVNCFVAVANAHGGTGAPITFAG